MLPSAPPPASCPSLLICKGSFLGGFQASMPTPPAGRGTISGVNAPGMRPPPASAGSSGVPILAAKAVIASRVAAPSATMRAEAASIIAVPRLLLRPRSASTPAPSCAVSVACSCCSLPSPHLPPAHRLATSPAPTLAPTTPAVFSTNAVAIQEVHVTCSKCGSADRDSTI